MLLVIAASAALAAKSLGGSAVLLPTLAATPAVVQSPVAAAAPVRVAEVVPVSTPASKTLVISRPSRLYPRPVKRLYPKPISRR